MADFHYNRLGNTRIKSISLGLMVMLVDVLIIGFYLSLAGGEINLYVTLIISLVATASVCALVLIDFEQVIGKSASGQIATFYKLGPWKFNVKTYGAAAETSLVQNDKRYYCLTVKTTDGQVLVLEKHPTLDVASERLEELRSAIE